MGSKRNITENVEVVLTKCHEVVSGKLGKKAEVLLTATNTYVGPFMCSVLMSKSWGKSALCKLPLVLLYSSFSPREMLL